MVTHGDLTRAEYDQLKTEPIKLDFKVEENYDGQAKYFREAVANYLKDWCKEEGYDLYTSGLRLYTTIDTRMQKYAEEAARKADEAGAAELQQSLEHPPHTGRKGKMDGTGTLAGREPQGDSKLHPGHRRATAILQGSAGSFP